MKLSIKASLLFVGMTVLTIIFYVMTSHIISNYLYDGELTRITGITTGSVGRVEGKMRKVITYGYNYKEQLISINKVYEKYGLDLTQTMGIEEAFKRDEYEYNIVLDQDYKIVLSYLGQDTIPETHQIKIHHKIMKAIERNETLLGTIVTESQGYFLTVLPLMVEENENPKYSYFIGIDIINEEYGEIGKSEALEGRVEIVDTLDEGLTQETHDIGKDRKILINYKEDVVEAYYKLPNVLEGVLYVKVVEPLVVQTAVKQNHQKLLILLILMLIGMNILGWYIMDKIMIKPMKKINKEINKVYKTGKKAIDGIESRDEFGVLTKDINAMLKSIHDAHQALRLKDKKYHDILNHMSNAFGMYRVIYDEGDTIKKVICIESNEKMNKIFEKRSEELEDKDEVQALVSLEQIQWILSTLSRTKEPYKLEQLKLTENMWGQGSVYFVEDGMYYIIINDITKIKQYSDKMKYMANYDMLTGLNNRYSLYQHLEQLIKKQIACAVYFIDLDHFKKVNDTIGHTKGDEVLCAIANRLKQFINENTFVTRVGGDEFFIVKKGITDKVQASIFAEIVIKEVAKLLREDTKCPFGVGLSIGISLYPEHTETLENLMRYADVAMYHSKTKEGNHYEVFSDVLLENIHIEHKLKKAIANQEFVVYYQPIYDVNQRGIVGAEALVRWNDRGKLVSPCKFINIAKQTGAISAIDFFVLEKACQFCKKWHDRGYSHFSISVNMSGKTLNDPDVIEKIQEILVQTGLAPECLKIEITEDDIIYTLSDTTRLIHKIRKKGIQVALDDFGIGYSSFNHMKRLPIDVLKIDKSLIEEIEKDEKTQSIIKTLIELAHGLGLKVVAEGIEYEEQLDSLSYLACDMIQGYYISQPVEETVFDLCMKHYN